MMEATNTNTHILDAIPFEPDLQALFKRLHLKEGSDNAAEFLHLLEQARLLAHPRALYQAAYITDRGEDWLEINQVRFISRVLAVNLVQVHRVFPYLATCGPELQEWADGIEDMLLNFWAEAIKEAALLCAIRALNEDMEARYRAGKMASMNPGSLADWPLPEQRTLFGLIGAAAGQIGVCLTDSLLMVPTKSVSGIRFPTEAAFESCQLCPREDCPGRRALYDPGLYESRYCKHNGSGNVN